MHYAIHTYKSRQKQFSDNDIATKLAKYDSIHIHLHDIQTLPCSTLASSNGSSKHHHSLRLCKELSRRFNLSFHFYNLNWNFDYRFLATYILLNHHRRLNWFHSL